MTRMNEEDKFKIMNEALYNACFKCTKIIQNTALGGLLSQISLF